MKNQYNHPPCPGVIQKNVTRGSVRMSKRVKNIQQASVKKYPASVPDNNRNLGVRLKTIRKQYASRNKRSKIKKIVESEDMIFVCPICRKVLESPVTVLCGHTFCKGCLESKQFNRKCLECDVRIDSISRTNILVKDIVDKWKEQQTKQDPYIRNCSRRSHFPYCLRSHCNGHHDLNSTHIVPNEENTLLASDLECILCSQCLLSPVTTTCGHTFCRECLARVLDHGLACPLCMAPLTPIEQHRGENLLLKQAIQLHAYKEHCERIQLENVIETLETNQIPIFICTNAFPNVACPLFVYEPKYRLLARRCLQSNIRQFGMAAKTVNGDKFALYGTLLEIRDSISLHDGTSIMTTIGLRRFKVLSRGEQDGYDTATVQYIRDNHVLTEKLPILYELLERVYNKTVRWLQTLTPRLLAEIERCIGTMPEIEKNWSVLPEGPTWTWWLIAVLPLSIQLKVGFLASTSLEKRLLAVEKMLDHLKIRMKAVEGIKCQDPEETGESCERSVDILYHNH